MDNRRYFHQSPPPSFGLADIRGSERKEKRGRKKKEKRKKKKGRGKRFNLNQWLSALAAHIGASSHQPSLLPLSPMRVSGL